MAMTLSDYENIVLVRIFEDQPADDDLIYPEKAAVSRLEEMGFIEKVDGKWVVKGESGRERKEINL